ncbi:DUF4390 domain-containing protein [Methylibium sp.]|uniref:DUF4390 domain-containing protein n=1 Tax=Methylibium sp. TaxID=2067992 RepID=UPI003D0D1660
MFTASVRRWLQPAAGRSAWCLSGLWLALALWLVLGASLARAEGIDLGALDLSRSEDGLLLGYTASVELPRAVEDALQKGVPLHFVAQAEVFRSRWYWRDKRVARATRNWRLTWQPLTRRYRVNFGSLSQSYDTLSDALGAVQRANRWKLAEPGDLEDGAGQYLEFSLRLDTSQLPRPLQISFGGQADWELAVERRVSVPEAQPR